MYVLSKRLFFLYIIETRVLGQRCKTFDLSYVRWLVLMYRTDGNAANTGGLKKKGGAFTPIFKDDRSSPPYFKIGAERTYAFGSPVIGAPSLLFAHDVHCAVAFISVFATDSSMSRKEMTLGRDTVGFACLSVSSAQKPTLSERERTVIQAGLKFVGGTFTRAVYSGYVVNQIFKTYRICIIHVSGCS